MSHGYFLKYGHLQNKQPSEFKGMVRNLKSIFGTSAIILLFTFTLTILVPYQGDDTWLNYFHHQGFHFALSFFKWSYLNHVSRPSDFLAMLMGDDLKLIYSIFAAIFTLFGIIVIFSLGMGRLPNDKRSDGFILISIFITLFLFKNSSGVNQAVLSMAPGVPQLTSIIPASLLIPYLYLLRGSHLPEDTFKLNSLFLLWGLLAGFTVEYVPPAVAVTIVFCLLITAFINKKKIPLWCFTGLIALIIGWLFIILAPGPYIRAEMQDSEYFYHVPFWLKLLHSFSKNAIGWYTYRKVPVILTLFLLLDAWRRQQKLLIIPILLVMTCWLSDQAYTFGVGEFSKEGVRFAGNIFLFAALFNLAAPYLNYFKKISGLVLLIFFLIFLKITYGAYIFHLQAEYRNNIIKNAHIPPAHLENFHGTVSKLPQPIMVPSYVGINPFLIKQQGRICVGFVRLCIFGEPSKSIQPHMARDFFAKKYINYQNYLQAVPLKHATNIKISGPPELIHNNARWFKIFLPFNTGYQNLGLKGILFITKPSNISIKDLSIQRYYRKSFLITILKFIKPSSFDNEMHSHNSILFIPNHPEIIAIPILTSSYFPEKFSITIQINDHVREEKVVNSKSMLIETLDS